MPQQEPAQFQLCVALYENAAESPEELSFKAGDILFVLEMDSPGLEGWWICGLNGKQGICPQNRLRLMTETEQASLRETKRRSWQNFLMKTNAGATSKTPEPGFVYDSPSQRHTIPVAQGQYDVPPTAQTVHADESYDVPKPTTVNTRSNLPPTGASSLTPSSSISSLTTDSNRSSLIQQDYDVPRATVRQGQVPQGHYDVPKGGEVTLDMTSALEWLGRLEADVTGSISRLLALATAGWRTKAKLEPRIGELKGSVARLGSSLHDLTVFSHAVLASHHETGLGQKLSPLVAALNKADLQVKDCLNQLDAIGWSVIVLADDSSSEKDSDVLDKLVQTAAALTDDIRAIASFIQGNSTLLFKRTTGSAQTPVDGQYMNLSGRSVLISNTEEYIDPRNSNGSAAINAETTPHRPLSEIDRKTLELYAGHYWQQASLLDQAIESFLAAITNNQPPKSFLSQCKLVVLAAHNMIAVGDIIERTVEDEKIRTVAGCCNRLTLEAVGSLVARTAAAAAHFPSVRAVQKMVDAVVGLTNPPQRLSHTLHAAAAVPAT